ncbi:MAG: hypothetical protein WBC85_04180 [Planktotalea sp.]|uniref:hypothetical protein n=1 Tax=Planktotalea sp. TaxID=2029877 RepID=UPI003C757F27
MTTYTLTGFTLTWSDTNGDGDDDTVVVGTTELQVVSPDNDISFVYNILAIPMDPNELPEVEITNNYAYNVRLDGTILDQTYGISIGEVHWGTDSVGQFIAFGGNGPSNHIFHLNGDNLNITTPADVAALDASATYFGEVLVAG